MLQLRNFGNVTAKEVCNVRLRKFVMSPLRKLVRTAKEICNINAKEVLQ